MKIVIIGCGKLGYSLARNLVEQGHDLVVVECNKETYKLVTETLDVMSILGDGSSPMVLEQATEDPVDLLITTTKSDRVNVMSCLIARKYGVKKCIVIVNDPDNLMNPLLMDEEEFRLIHPKQIIANEMTRLVSNYNVTSLNTFAQGKVEILKFEIKGNNPVMGKSLEKIQLPSSWIFISIIRNNEIIIPHGNTIIEKDDSIVAMGTSSTRINMEKFMNSSVGIVKRVVIMGGNQIAIYLSRRLVKQGVSVRIIEKDPQRAEEIAIELPEAMVLNGDGTSGEMLKEAGVQKADYFIALTGDDEGNILGSLLAKDMGCRRIVVISRNPQYSNIIRSIGVDEVVDPMMITVNEILQFVGRGNIFSTTMIENGKARLFQLIAGSNSKIIKKPLNEIKFPPDSLVGLIIREGKVIIPKGTRQIQKGDKVILVSVPGMIKKTEKLF